MKLLLKVTAQGLVPMYDSDYDEKKKLKIGSEVVAEIRTPRNLQFHKKFFALVRLAYDNLPDKFRDSILSEEDLRREITMRAGYYETHQTLTGKTIYLPKSISFAKMDEAEFETLYQRSIDVILRYILVGNTKEEIANEIINYL